LQDTGSHSEPTDHFSKHGRTSTPMSTAPHEPGRQSNESTKPFRSSCKAVLFSTEAPRPQAEKSPDSTIDVRWTRRQFRPTGTTTSAEPTQNPTFSRSSRH
jgi:hypothetical protein